MSLEPVKKPCAPAEGFWSHELVATWPDSPEGLNPGSIQFPEIFWLSSRVSCLPLPFFTPFYPACKPVFSFARSLNPPKELASGLRGPESQWRVFLPLGLLVPSYPAFQAYLFVCEVLRKWQETLHTCWGNPET